MRAPLWPLWRAARASSSGSGSITALLETVRCPLSKETLVLTDGELVSPLGLAFRVTGATSESSMSCGFFVVFLTAQRANLAILGRFRDSRMSALSGFFCFYVMLAFTFKF